MLVHGVPDHIRSDNGPEFIARDIRKRLSDNNVRTIYIEPGHPWENGHNEAFNSRLRDELLEREIFFTLEEAGVMLESFRVHFNTERPHSALGYQTPREAIEGGLYTLLNM